MHPTRLNLCANFASKWHSAQLIHCLENKLVYAIRHGPIKFRGLTRRLSLETNVNARLYSMVLTAALLPGTVHAGTGSATGSAAMTVTSQCSVTGATVNLGTFNTSQTVGDLAAVLGYLDGDGGANFNRGTMSDGALNLGSVTCGSGVPYTFRVHTLDYSQGDYLRFNLGSKTLSTSIWAQKVGDQMLEPNWYNAPTRWIGVSTQLTGTGAPETIQGNIYLELSYGDMALSDKIGVAGTYSAPFFYRVDF